MAGRACKFIRSCFPLGGGGAGDDTERIVNDRVPPVGGAPVSPQTRAATAARQSEDDRRLQAISDSLEERFQRRFEILENQVADLRAVCDKQQSQIVSLREQLRYREPLVVTYSPTYRPDDREVLPRFSE